MLVDDVLVVEWVVEVLVDVVVTTAVLEVELDDDVLVVAWVVEVLLEVLVDVEVVLVTSQWQEDGSQGPKQSAPPGDPGSQFSPHSGWITPSPQWPAPQGLLVEELLLVEVLVEELELEELDVEELVLEELDVEELVLEELEVDELVLSVDEVVDELVVSSVVDVDVEVVLVTSQ